MKLQLPDTITPAQLAQISAILNAPVIDGKETHICGVLDESGSMLVCKASTILAYNSFINEIKDNSEKGGKTYTSSLVFSTNAIRFISKHVDASRAHLARLTNVNYRPSGGTPYYDALDKAITELEQYDVPGGDKSFWIASFTDGVENASSTKGTDLSRKIRLLQDTGRWTFTVAGANISLDDLQDNLGIYARNMMTYDYSPQGIQVMSSTHNTGTESFMNSRAAGASASAGFYNAPGPTITPEEIKAMMDAQARPIPYPKDVDKKEQDVV